MDPTLRFRGRYPFLNSVPSMAILKLVTILSSSWRKLSFLKSLPWIVWRKTIRQNYG